MLFLYNKKLRSFAPCDGTTFGGNQILERKDIESWVEDNPSILGDGDLLIVTTEFDGFDKTNERLDLLALDRDGNLVVIELKRDDSGRNVDLQALKYAAYCSTLQLDDVVAMYAAYRRKKTQQPLDSQDALRELQSFAPDFDAVNQRPRIILVAREFRAEVTASVLWLRNFDIDISCVKLDPYIVSHDEVAISSSTLIPLPEAKDFVMRVQRKEAHEGGLSHRQQEYVQFFGECIAAMQASLPGDYALPAPRCYYQIHAGIPGIHYEWVFGGRPRSRLGIELHCEKADAKSNQSVIQACETVLDRLEEAFGTPVVIQREGWGRSGARLYVEKKQGHVDSELRDWAVDGMLKMIGVLQPVIDAYGDDAH